MEQSKQQQIRKLTDRLNRCRYEYYNLNAPSLTDAEYDALFDELSTLEKETGFSMTNSPTQTVGCYPAVSALVKTVHPIPLLSLDKTKSSAELLRFAGEQMVMLMLKLDGLTVKLTYENGLLMEAATRGDGDTGENITHNVLGISGIPDKIPYKEQLVVTGEAFIRPSDFEALRDTLRDGNGEPYKNGRNLAAGSVRLLDCGACKDRRVTFMAFNVLEGFEEYPWKSQRLRAIEQLGFPICKYLASKQALTQFDMDAGIRHLRKYAQENDIPIDGIVVTYNDAAYAKSCGRTGHHYKDGLAFKFEDDTYETVLRSIEWTPSRSGEIAPVAVFDTVEIDGCAVSRASLHNLSFIENLELAPGCRIKVSKRNQIIPHVEENLDRNCYSAGELVFLILPHGEVLGAAAFQPVKHIVHRIFEGFVILPDFHAVYHFHQRIHVAFFLRPLKDDVGHKGAVQEGFCFCPELVALLAVAFGVGNQGGNKFQNIAFCLDIGQRIVVHGF